MGECFIRELLKTLSYRRRPVSKFYKYLILLANLDPDLRRGDNFEVFRSSHLANSSTGAVFLAFIAREPLQCLCYSFGTVLIDSVLTKPFIVDFTRIRLRQFQHELHMLRHHKIFQSAETVPNHITFA